MMKKRGIQSAVLLLSLMAVFFNGCSEVNPDYQSLGDPTLAYHPFGDVSEHGSYFAEEGYSFAECTECHGADLGGLVYDESKNPIRSCYRCHTHENHDLLISGGFADADDHPDYLESHGWDIGLCFQCHVDITHDPESRVVLEAVAGLLNAIPLKGFLWVRQVAILATGTMTDLRFLNRIGHRRETWQAIRIILLPGSVRTRLI